MDPRDHESGGRDIFDSKSSTDSSGESGLSRTQFALQDDEITCSERAPELLTESEHLLARSGDPFCPIHGGNSS